MVQGRRPRDGPQGRAVVAQEVQRLTQAQEGAAAEPTPCHGSLTSSDPLGSSHPLTLAQVAMGVIAQQKMEKALQGLNKQ